MHEAAMNAQDVTSDADALRQYLSDLRALFNARLSETARPPTEAAVTIRDDAHCSQRERDDDHHHHGHHNNDYHGKRPAAGGGATLLLCAAADIDCVPAAVAVARDPRSAVHDVAAAGALLERVRELLCCPVCAEPYGDGSGTVDSTVGSGTVDSTVGGGGGASKPHVLPGCGHTFCADCIGRWYAAEAVSCPVCRVRSPLPGTALRPPRNYALRAIADLLAHRVP